MSMKGSAIALLLVLVVVIGLLLQPSDTTRGQVDATIATSSPNEDLVARIEVLESTLASQNPQRILRDLQQRVTVLEQKLNQRSAAGREESSSQLDATRGHREFGEIKRKVSSVESKVMSVQRDLSPLKQEINSLRQKVRELDTTVARIDYRQ